MVPVVTPKQIGFLVCALGALYSCRDGQISAVVFLQMALALNLLLQSNDSVIAVTMLHLDV